MTDSLRVNSHLTIPGSELRFSFVRSSGPGGQNVNKVASKAVLRWSIKKSGVLSDLLRERLLTRLGRRLTDRGELILTSQRFRDQPKNIADCRDKLRTIVASAAARPRLRKKTRPTKASRESRLKEKRIVSDKKRGRGRPRDDE